MTVTDHAAIDTEVLKLLPKADGHMHFRSIVFRFWEEHDFDIERATAESVIHDSLKRLERAGKITVKSYRDSQLCYSLKQ